MNSAGFTLIELMITVSILAIITAITVPSFGNFADNSHVQQAILNVTTDIELVKSKSLGGAYPSGGPCNTTPKVAGCRATWGIEFCPGGDTTRYTLKAYNINGTVFGGGELELSTSDTVTKTLPTNISFSSTGCSTSGRWVFSRITGLPLFPNSGTDSVTLVDTSGNLSRTITINASSGKLKFSNP